MVHGSGSTSAAPRCWRSSWVTTVASSAVPGRAGHAVNLGLGADHLDLAAGVVIDGRLHRGHRGAAGEIGHLPLDPLGLPCSCGQRGCLEAVASGAALVAAWNALRPRGQMDLMEASVRQKAQPAADEVWRATAGGDAVATDVVTRFAHGVAAASLAAPTTAEVCRVEPGAAVSLWPVAQVG